MYNYSTLKSTLETFAQWEAMATTKLGHTAASAANCLLLMKAEALDANHRGSAGNFGASIVSQAKRFHSRRGAKVFQVSVKQAAVIEKLWAEVLAGAPKAATVAEDASYEAQRAAMLDEDGDGSEYDGAA